MRSKICVIIIVMILFVRIPTYVQATETEPSLVLTETAPTVDVTQIESPSDIVDPSSTMDITTPMETAIPVETGMPDNPSEDTQSQGVGEFIVSVIIEFFGAFLGVLAALYLESRSENKQWDDVNASLLEELLNIGKDLEERMKNDYIYYQYATPVWDINMAAGNLSTLTHPHSSKKQINKEYIEIYVSIHYAQALERDYIQGRLLMLGKNCNDDFFRAIDEARKAQCKSILKMINELKETT